MEQHDIDYLGFNPDAANYVIKTSEGVLTPTENCKWKIILRNCIWAIIAIMLISSLFFRINIFDELSWTARILLIALTIGFGFYNGKKEYTPSPMELYFYDNYLVFYLPKRYYSNRVSRKQINIIEYNNASKCVYKANSQRIQIYGDGRAKWYNYKKDGSLPLNPTDEHSFKDGMIYFNIQFATDIDFKKAIEEHSPMKVIIEND